MRIGIVGAGVVGSATARCFIEHVDEVRVHDIDPRRATATLDDTLRSDLIFVCLPTPQKANSLECDLSAVESFFCDREKDCRAGKFVLRSTVPIGTTRRLRDKYGLDIIHSPEFLTARCAMTDAQMPARNIIGSGEFFSKSEITLKNLYIYRFPAVPLLVMSSNNSEAVKLMQNSFFAVKVAFWNEMYQLAAKMGLDWNRVQQAILADGRIAHSHTKVPGPDGKFGFGGACLPKDLANLTHLMQINGLSDWMCTAAYERNLEDRKR